MIEGMPTPYPRAYPLPRHFAEQEALDDFAEQMTNLDSTTQQLRRLEARIDTEIERVRESVRPKKDPDEPVHPRP